VLEPRRIKSTERAKRPVIPPVYSLRGIRAYDELQIVVTEVGQVKQTVTILSGGEERLFSLMETRIQTVLESNHWKNEEKKGQKY
jgi:hypothetical protein